MNGLEENRICEPRLTLAGLQWDELATCNMQFNKWVIVSKSRETALQAATILYPL
jgi:hypothetical protein